MGHALRQGARHWEYVQDDTIYGVPRDELLDGTYHAHLAKMIRISRPKVDLSEHMRLAGDAGGGGDVMSAFLGAAAKPRLSKTESKQPSGSCELAVVDAEGNWVQMMDTLQGSGIPGMVIGGVPMVGSHADLRRPTKSDGRHFGERRQGPLHHRQYTGVEKWPSGSVGRFAG